MADTEEYFPRGGKKPVFKEFKQTSNFLGTLERTEKKKKKLKKKSEGDDGYLSDEISEFDVSTKNCAVGLSYQIVKEGLQILGRVSQVLETRLQVSLPCRMQGTVMACHISDAYNKLLEAYVGDQVDSIKELRHMFRPGQYVAVRVLEVDRANLMLSLMPQHVNQGKVHTEIEKGTIFQAAVTSVEDHGYVLDLGVPNTKAFLPKKNAREDVELDVGYLTWCVVKSVTPGSEHTVVSLSSQGAALAPPLRRKPARGVAAVTPGASLEFTVDKALENGIEGHIFDGITSYVQRQHADRGKGKKPTLGQKVRAHLLYEMPTRKAPYLTLRPIFETTTTLEEEQTLKEGDMVEDALVIKITSRSIVFKLGSHGVGTMSVKRVRAVDDLSDEEIIAKSYPIGSTHRVRVLCYNLSDYRYSVSDDPKTLNEKYFTLRQLNVGDIVEATESAKSNGGVTLKVGKLTGFVPMTHLTDAGVYIDPKKPTAGPKFKHKPGHPIKARVLALDLDSNSLILTLKPSLLDPEVEALSSYHQAEVGKAYTGVIKLRNPAVEALSSYYQAEVGKAYTGVIKADDDDDLTLKPSLLDPAVEALSSYHQAEVGKAYTGVIKHAAEDYVLVSFFSGVSCFIPRQYVTRDAASLRAAFHQGQIVKCTILKVDPENKKMTGSLTTAPFWPAKKREVTEKRKNKDESEVPKKKQKVNSEDETEKPKEGKKKKDKKSKQESETVETAEESPKKKKSKSKSKEIIEEVPEDDKIESDMEIDETEQKTKPKKKKDKNKHIEETEDITEEVETKKKKKSKKVTEVITQDLEDNKASSESDHIDTDIPESDEVLTPIDMQLVDLSDCDTAKKCKKRVVSLIRSIEARARRIDVIDGKITDIEERGLHGKNKKYHTAMHAEKNIVQERIKILAKALKKAQDKLKEFPETDESKEWKKKDKKKKEIAEVKEAVEDKTIELNDDAKVDKVSTKESKRKDKAKEGKKSKAEAAVVPELDVPSAKDFWTMDVDTLNQNAQKEVESSSSSDEEDTTQPKKKRKKLTVSEKLAKARAEDERVRALELARGDAPASVEGYERALLASPDDSRLWISYMALHLQATEIEKARAVARRALSSISFREEQEKLNVWLALLNLENRFGTKETMQKTLEEALQMNDTYEVHSKLLDIYADTAKVQELSTLIDLMTRRYKTSGCFTRCGAAAYRAGLVDAARRAMQHAIKVLDKREHVNVLVQFALLEASSGSRERAEALFEQLLGAYPQRVDVCCTYVDMMVKAKELEQCRQVLERMTSLKLPARKMKVLFKKWIEVEEKLGDEKQIESVRQKAMEFIEKAKF
ncbi:hypothetical protein JYU34_018377 [Plutella xylostella]|uniref:S1 motif domain-containing protein n=1 Tax=Plutella xylostella TaxID=51655 RepID=A0ABQ7PXJ4_PLUXY|nr:hypothetical protein JYU34_018377 [Plutella xylostella]